MSGEELRELAVLQWRFAGLLRRELGCEKEYSACFAEVEGFNHIHFHLIARPHDLPGDLRGTRIFAMLKPDEREPIPPNEIAEFCASLRDKAASDGQTNGGEGTDD